MTRFATIDAALVRRVAWIRREQEGKVEADERGLSFDGALILPRPSVADGFVEPRADAFPLVHLRRRGLRPAVVIRVRDIEKGRALLRAMGLGGSQQALSHRVSGPSVGLPPVLRRFMLAAFLVGLSFFPVAFACVALSLAQVAMTSFAVWLAAMAGFGAAALTPTRLVIGGDGLRFSWLGRSRFIAYADILVVNMAWAWESGAWQQRGVQITLVDGEVVSLPVRGGGAPIYERISEAVEAWWRRDGALETALVQRGPRDARGWLRALRSIGARATADYRSASMADDLWRIVEDVAAPADARAGAAIALRGALGDEGRARLRRTADATAMPRLRIAIEAAASEREDEEALVAALAEVEEGSGKAKRVLGPGRDAGPRG